MRRLFPIVSSAAIVFALATGQVYAQVETPAQTIQIAQVKGEVLKRDSDKITIKNGDTVQEYSIPRNIKINRNTFGSTIEDIQPNDQVTLTVGPSGEVLSVDATSGQVSDTGKWAIPLVLVLAILAAVGYLMYQKTTKGQIKTQAA
jgi:hypothetical protein